MSFRIVSILSICFLWACGTDQQEFGKISIDPLQFVDPFIGTGFHGHTFPGASLPVGMVQLSPDTRLPGWDASSGYHYSDSTIYGFSHTHLSGTGIGDLGDVLSINLKRRSFMSIKSCENYINQRPKAFREKRTVAQCLLGMF